MDLTNLTQFLMLTLVLCIGLGAVAGAAARVNIAENWEENRCDPYVVPFSAWFKPADDLRTPSQFATDNWSFCQKQYVQGAIAMAAEIPKELAAVEAGTVGIVQDIAGVVGDVFYNLWKFCYQTYSTFMTQMKGVAKLFQNFMVNLYSMVEKLNASALSIIFGLISLITATVNAIQITLIVAIIVIGIILILQILLFFVLMPISSLVLTVTALVSVAVVVVASAIAAATVAELFSPGTCFVKGTPVLLGDGTTKAIESIRLGEILAEGGVVTACHSFWSPDDLYLLEGILVTGDHLVWTSDGKRIPVRSHPGATLQPPTFWRWLQGGTELWCLTTSNRIIPCKATATAATAASGPTVRFADWEEIDEEDTPALTAWYTEVWRTLNKEIPIVPAATQVLEAEAGLSPDCQVACMDWRGTLVYKPIRDIVVGERVFDSPTTTTMVVGKVRIAGDQATDAVSIPCPDGPQIMTCATWVRDYNSIWQSASAFGQPIEIHVIEWQHLYTKSGSFMLNGYTRVRDASDVGLDHLRPLVDSIVLSTESGITM